MPTRGRPSQAQKSYSYGSGHSGGQGRGRGGGRGGSARGGSQGGGSWGGVPREDVRKVGRGRIEGRVHQGRGFSRGGSRGGRDGTANVGRTRDTVPHHSDRRTIRQDGRNARPSGTKLAGQGTLAGEGTLTGQGALALPLPEAKAPSLSELTEKIGDFSKRRRFGEALQAYHEIARRGLSPNFGSYLAIVNACAKAGQVSLAEQFRQRCAATLLHGSAEEANNDQKAILAGAVMKAYVNAGRTREAYSRVLLKALDSIDGSKALLKSVSGAWAGAAARHSRTFNHFVRGCLRQGLIFPALGIYLSCLTRSKRSPSGSPPGSQSASASASLASSSSGSAESETENDSLLDGTGLSLLVELFASFGLGRTAASAMGLLEAIRVKSAMEKEILYKSKAKAYYALAVALHANAANPTDIADPKSPKKKRKLSSPVESKSTGETDDSSESQVQSEILELLCKAESSLRFQQKKGAKRKDGEEGMTSTELFQEHSIQELLTRIESLRKSVTHRQDAIPTVLPHYHIFDALPGATDASSKIVDVAKLRQHFADRESSITARVQKTLETEAKAQRDEQYGVKSNGRPLFTWLSEEGITALERRYLQQMTDGPSWHRLLGPSGNSDASDPPTAPFQRVVVELGGGDGDWFAELRRGADKTGSEAESQEAESAVADGKTLFIGNEYRWTRSLAMALKRPWDYEGNGKGDECIVAGGDGTVLLSLLREGSVDEIQVNYPEPPQIKDGSSAWIQASFFRQVWRALKVGGRFRIISDQKQYLQFISGTFVKNIVSVIESPSSNEVARGPSTAAMLEAGTSMKASTLPAVAGKGARFQSLTYTAPYHFVQEESGALAAGSYFARMWSRTEKSLFRMELKKVAELS